MEYHTQRLINKIKKFAPEFEINSCFRSIKVSQLYSHTFKPKLDIFDTSNAVYKFTCSCNSLYIGQTKRPLSVRAREHQQASKAPKKYPFHGVYHHISSCPCYESNLKNYLETFKNILGPLKITNFQLRNEFYRTHFKIVQKNFRSLTERLQSEAYHIRINRPKLNDQTESRKYFKLFWNEINSKKIGHLKFLMSSPHCIQYTNLNKLIYHII